MHLMGQVIERSIKITTHYGLMSLGQALKTMLQECPYVLPLRENLSGPMRCGPGLLVYDHKVLWPGKIQSYLQ